MTDNTEYVTEYVEPDRLEAASEDPWLGTPADASADASAAGEEPAEEESFEARVERVRAAVMRQPLHREILYKTLGFCRERRDLPDIEQKIATYPEFKHATQNQYRLISFLTNAGGLECLELDDEGEIVAEERKAGLSEDEIDDLVASYAYATTDAGLAIWEEMNPRKRILDLLGIAPEHEETYAELLEFCASPKTYKEIEDLLKERDILSFGMAPNEPAIHPSYFVDTLERVGGIVWDGGWIASEEGRAIVETIRTQL
ncbi:MAG: hypothetical protein AB2L09_10880 [Coriobacteriia bacterium]